MLVMQDMDVETLMQEIKQWGPQDQAPQVQDQAPQVQDQAPQESAIMNDPGSQSPGRLSLDKTDQPSSSSVQVDTPDHSQNQEEEEEASSSNDKASLESCQCWSCLVTFAKPACPSHIAGNMDIHNITATKFVLFTPTLLYILPLLPYAVVLQ